jgi:hypothetical protein
MKLNRLFVITALLLNCTIPYSIRDYNTIAVADLEPVVISDRVGEAIDSLERDNYKLFPNVKDFESAEFHKIEGGYVVNLTKTNGERYRSVNRDPHGLDILRAYLDNYESIKPMHDSLMKKRKIERYTGKNMPVYTKVLDPFEKKWKIVDYDDALGLPITSEEVALYNKRKYNCCLYSVGCLIPTSLFTGFIWFASVMGDWSGDSYSADEAIFLTSSIISAVFGVFIGRGVDRSETIKAIKKGRKLKPVE